MTAIHPGVFAAWVKRAEAAYPEWVAWMRRIDVPVNRETLMVCEALPAMAEGIFMAGYTTALVDSEPEPAAPAPAAEREGEHGE